MIIFLVGVFGVASGFSLSLYLNHVYSKEMLEEQFASSVPKTPTQFEKHAAEANMGHCSRLFAMLGQSVVGNSAYAAQSKWNKQAAQNHLVESLVSITENQTSESAIHAAGIVFTAPVGNSCEGTFVRVTPIKKTCQMIAESLIQLHAKSEMLGENQLMTMPNEARVMLVSFDNSCIAVTSLNAVG